MVLSKIAKALAEEKEYKLGEDLWLHNIPESKKEGIACRLIRLEENFAAPASSTIAIFIFYKNWETQSTRIEEITDFLKNSFGLLNNDWGVAEDITTRNYGQDEFGRHVTSILTIIKH